MDSVMEVSLLFHFTGPGHFSENKSLLYEGDLVKVADSQNNQIQSNTHNKTQKHPPLLDSL